MLSGATAHPASRGVPAAAGFQPTIRPGNLTGLGLGLGPRPRRITIPEACQPRNAALAPLLRRPSRHCGSRAFPAPVPVPVSGSAPVPVRKVRASLTAADDSIQGPGRPVVVLPGLGNNTADYDALKASLEARGLPCVVADVARADWLRNAAGLLDANYWKGTLKPRPVLDWYLQRIEKALVAAKAAAPGPSPQVTLMGHSAGGWLARLYMAELGHQDVAMLLTLGSPHLPPPRGIPGVTDQTRGLLYHIQDNCPGAFHAPDVRYVCVSGRYIRGSPLTGRPAEAPQEALAASVAAAGAAVTPTEPTAAVAAAVSPSLADASASVIGSASASASATGAWSGEGDESGRRNEEDGAPTLQSRVIGQGYKQVCGFADVWGDGVVPEPSALLPDAVHVVLEGVYHSPVGASDERPWYGTEKILKQWEHHLYE